MRSGMVGIAVLVAATAIGGIEHTILHGVSVGRVRASVGPDPIPGLSAEDLKAIAESRLKEAAIPIDPSGQAVLQLVATVVNAESGMCFVTIEGSLVEPARLERNGVSVGASSWHRGGTVIAKAGECAASTAKAAEGALSDFVEVYRAMNPNTPGKP